MRRRTLIALGLGATLRAQTASTLEFEVASVRRSAILLPSPQGTADGPAPPPPPPMVRPTPGGLTIQNATLKYCPLWAYGLRYPQVSGPPWINEDHYEIRAKTSQPAETGELKKMLQRLLTARFRLSLHSDTKEQPVLGIVVARRGIKLAASPGGTTSHPTTLLPGGGRRIVAKNTELDFLEQMLQQPFRDPVVNLTGLTGAFDFTFDIPRYHGQPDDLRAEISAALEQQLGLRLEPRKAPLEMLVIEKGNPNPTEN